MTGLRLSILGCGSATPSTRHLPSCQVLDVRGNLMMIDCGEGAQLQVRRMRLKWQRLTDIFISHLHGDHCFGLPGLLSSMALHGTTRDITVHTFAEGIRLFSAWTDFFCRDLPFNLHYHEISPRGGEVIVDTDAISVTTIPLRHRVPAVGFRFDEKPKRRHIIPEMTAHYGVPHYLMNALRDGDDLVLPDGTVVANELLTRDADPSVSYAYCSDTRFSERVVSAVEGVDWLYHEATYDNALHVMAKKRYHSTAGEAAAVARDAGAKHLIIGHYSQRYNDESLLLRQAQEIFPDTILAREGMGIELM